jgi:hypothetical protein
VNAVSVVSVMRSISCFLTALGCQGSCAALAATFSRAALFPPPRWGSSLLRRRLSDQFAVGGFFGFAYAPARGLLRPKRGRDGAALGRQRRASFELLTSGVRRAERTDDGSGELSGECLRFPQ